MCHRNFAVGAAVLILAATLVATPEANSAVIFTSDKPAPRTAAGYQQLWSTLDPIEWGAGDVSLSVRMPSRDGRITRVWLYGDTLRDGGILVHSSAITQVGGSLHVSRHGNQLLPNGIDGSIYWIDDAQRVDGTARTIRLKARSMLVGDGGFWDFQDNGYWRYANVRLQDNGDVVFAQWVGKEFTDPPPPAYFEVDPDNPDHLYYSFRQHVKLPDGQILRTKCQGWQDSQLHGWEASRPIFYTEPQ